MSSSKDYEFEALEKYYGDEATVRKTIENCPCCGSKFAITHYPDSGNWPLSL